MKVEQQIASYCERLHGIEVLWSYGSRATGNYEDYSDYDIALALDEGTTDREKFIEDFRYELTKNIGAPISLVDINHIPIPLASNINSDGIILYCNSDMRLRQEQQRIWSMWEEYKYQYEQYGRNRYEAYVFAISEQVNQHIDGLDELSETIHSRPLSFNERSAVERSVQVVIEAAIGCSKHFLKYKGKFVPSESRAAIERVYELLAITNPAVDAMRGAIGMRNAIIHDYLNLDWRKIERVLRDRKYHQVKAYVNIVSGKLLEQ